MSRRCRSDNGTGIVGTLAGVTVFLSLLLFCVQLLTNLYATSTVTTVAQDAARRVATRGRVPYAEDLFDAEANARRLLGPLGDRASFDWSLTDRDAVRLRIAVTTHRLSPLLSLVGLDLIDRTVSYRIERPQ